MRHVWRIASATLWGFGLLALAGWARRVFPQGTGAFAYRPQFALVISLAFWGVGLAVLGWANPPRLAINLACLNVVAGLAVIIAPAADAGLNLAREAEFVAMDLLPMPFLYFFAKFPPGIDVARRGFRRWIPLVAAGVSILLLVLYFHAAPSGTNPHPLAQPLLGYLGLSLVAGVSLVGQSYRSSTSVRQRDQLKVVGLGTAGTLPFALLSVLPQAVAGRPWLAPEVTVLGTTLIPLSIGYAMLRRELLDVNLVISRSVVYGILGALLLGAYFALIASARRLIPTLLGPDDTVVVIVLAVAAATMYGPLKARLDRAVDRWIYGDDYDLAASLAWFSHRLAAIEPVGRLAGSVVGRLGRELNLASVEILLSHDTRATTPADAGGSGWMGRFRSVARWEGSNASRGLGPIVDVTALHPSPVRRFAEGVRVPLETGGHRLGLLCLGPKVSNGGYSAKDLALVSALAPQLSTALKNATLMEELASTVDELERLQAELTRAHDEERRAIGRDLHDGPLQELLLIQQIAHQLRDQPQMESVGDLVASLQYVIGGMRLVCVGLQPPDLEAGDLAAGLSGLAGGVRARHGLPVHVSITPPGAGEELAQEARTSLYRCAQEMLQNVVKHAQATEAYVYLEQADGTLTLSVWDDGRGLQAPDRMLDLVREGHFGLAGLEQRAKKMGGELRVRSTQETGTQVSVIVPLGRSGSDGQDLAG